VRWSHAITAIIWGVAGAAGVAFYDDGFTQAAFMWGGGVTVGALFMAWSLRAPQTRL
jgi:hypothetical protein